MKKIERVKLDEDLKSIKSLKTIDIVMGLISIVSIILSYFAIWIGGVWIKIFLTIIVTHFILYHIIYKNG